MEHCGWCLCCAMIVSHSRFNSPSNMPPSRPSTAARRKRRLLKCSKPRKPRFARLPKRGLPRHSASPLALGSMDHPVEKQVSSAGLNGTGRALVFNAVQGVTKGWTRELDIVGIGYRAELKGKGMVVFTLGYSHPIEFPLPTGIEVAVDPKQTHLTISGIDRQKVGQGAADMRSLRKPDPYKNKGVRYSDEKLK